MLSTSLQICKRQKPVFCIEKQYAINDNSATIAQPKAVALEQRAVFCLIIYEFSLCLCADTTNSHAPQPTALNESVLPLQNMHICEYVHFLF